MEYTLYTDHLELSALDSEQLDKKLNRLRRYVPSPATTHISLRRDSHHRTGQTITCSITIKARKKSFFAERVADTVQDSLDEVIHALLHELKKEKDKAKDHHS